MRELQPTREGIHPLFMIDRIARNQVIAVVEAYLDDQITAFEFDDRLQAIESRDRTVDQVIHAAWHHYDDCKDHKVCLSKAEWDFFQRLLLILGSDAELTPSHSRRWSWDHLIAWLAFAGFVGIYFRVGWGGHLIPWAVPCGIISILIHVYRRRREAEFGPRERACTPFGSFSRMRGLRRRFPDFRKRRYRTEVGERKIRYAAENFLAWAIYYFQWLVFAPLVLFFQGFPSTVDRISTISHAEADSR